MKGLVDEIRLHPPRECWNIILETDYIRSAKTGKSDGISIGIEVPALPGLDLLIPALPFLDFLNVNELEWVIQMRTRCEAEGMNLLMISIMQLKGHANGRRTVPA